MPRKKEEKNFETALLKLEEQVKSLENGDVTLEESIDAYKKGMELAAYCMDVLKKAEQQIMIYDSSDYKKFEEGEN